MHTKQGLAGAFAMLALGTTSAAAQSAGCAAIDGYSSGLVAVRVSETLTPLAFDAGEVITLNATSVVSTQPVGTPVWAFADASLALGFGAGAISPTFVSSATPISESVTVPDGGIDGLALTEFGAWSTDLSGVTIVCVAVPADVLLPFVPPAGPTPEEEIARLAAAAGVTGRIVMLDARSLSRMRGRESLATRDALASFTRMADPESGSSTVSLSTKGHASMVGNLYTWFEITGFRARDDDADRTYAGRGIQIGADMALSPDMVAGLSFGVQDLDASVGAFSQDGVLRFLQPYFAYRSGAWSGEASLIYGRGEFDQTSDGGDGDGETRMAALTFNGGYDMALNDGVTLTPTLGLAHGVEEVEGKSGTLEDAPSEKVRFSEVSLGTVISQSITGGEVFAGLHADWLNTTSDTALVSDLLVDDGWTGRIELGVSKQIGRGLELDTSVELSGLGGDLRQTSGALSFAFRF